LSSKPICIADALLILGEIRKKAALIIRNRWNRKATPVEKVV